MQAGKNEAQGKSTLQEITSGIDCVPFMPSQLFPPPLPPATRADALQQLQAFARRAHRYGRERNFVVADHVNVSRLSAAIQHRLISQNEVVEVVLQHHPLGSVEKFVQEVLWRSYWKGWLEMRPSVWHSYLDEAARGTDAEIERAEQIATGHSGCAVMDDFARELIETGYLHNHARMWWASFWIHQQKLPWALGAKHFLNHLLDADAASNTLSWRWVAGLHTPGKTYLVRRDNIEHYHHAPGVAGMEMLEHTKAAEIRESALAPLLPYHALPSNCPPDDKRTALLLHAEDLSVETTELSHLRPEIVAFYRHDEESSSSPRHEWRNMAFADASRRAEAHFGRAVASLSSVANIVAWLIENRIERVVMMQPMVGPLRDALTALPDSLSNKGIQLLCLRREEDNRFFPHATGGFFTFWKKASRRLNA
jgi:deoxyribodipyrimidine photo-lyase